MNAINPKRLEYLLQPRLPYQKLSNIIKDINEIPLMTSEDYMPQEHEIYGLEENYGNKRQLNYDSALRIGSETSQFRYGFQRVNGRLRARLFLKDGTAGGFISSKNFAQYKEIINILENSTDELEILEAKRYAKDILQDEKFSTVLNERYLTVTKDKRIDKKTLRFKIDTLTKRYFAAWENSNYDPSNPQARNLAGELYYSYPDAPENLLMKQILNQRHNINSHELKKENRALRTNTRKYQTKDMSLIQRIKHYTTSESDNLMSVISDKVSDIFKNRNFSFNN